MTGEGRVHARIWIAASAAGLVVVALAALLFRVPIPGPPAGATLPSLAIVRLGGKSVDPLFTERATVFDPTPLFLPTEWNSAHKEFAVKEPGGSARPYPDQRVFDMAALFRDLPLPAAVPATPLEALSGDPVGEPLAGFGRTDGAVGPLPARAARVEIVEAGTGRRIFAEDLASARPPTTQSWQPMEFLAAVDSAGLVGPLVPTLRSGADEVDHYFSRYLTETLRIGSRLPPGFYRVTVGP